MERLSISSFIAHGHEYHLYAYEPIRNVPAGVMIRDAEHILPRSRAFQYTHHSTWSGFANFFRYKLLLEHGGWWADTDLVCERPFDFPDPYVFSSELSLGRQMVNTGAIKVPPGSELMSYAWDICETKDPAKLGVGRDRSRADGGGSRASWNAAVRAWLPSVFCPIGFREWKTILDPNVTFETGRETYAIHLWHEMWRAAGVNTSAHSHPASLYERLRRKYLAGQDQLSIESVKAVLGSLSLKAQATSE